MTQRIQPVVMDSRDFDTPQVFDIVLDATRPMTAREIEAQHEAAVSLDERMSVPALPIAVVLVCGSLALIVAAFMNGVLL